MKEGDAKKFGSANSLFFHRFLIGFKGGKFLGLICRTQEFSSNSVMTHIENISKVRRRMIDTAVIGRIPFPLRQR
ncbi:MAG: hypothetical protein ABSE51_12510 [Terracidiphilus sp.]|jgi:hypothetical protein